MPSDSAEDGNSRPDEPGDAGSPRVRPSPAGLGKATDVVVERAEGALVYDVDGNTLIDFVGGIGMLAVGHCPAAGRRGDAGAGAEVSSTSCALVGTYEPYVRLCELLNEITPGTFPKKTLLANSGAESGRERREAGARVHRPAGVICFEGGYHGRTLLTLSLTSKYGLFKNGFGPVRAGDRPAADAATSIAPRRA